MEEVNELSNAGIMSATCSLCKLSNVGIVSTACSHVKGDANQPLNVKISSPTASEDKGWMELESAMCMGLLNDPEIRDFCVAVTSGNVKKARSMLKKKKDLAEIKLSNGRLPIHIAALCGHEQMLEFFMSEISAHDDEPEVRLFFTTLKNSMFGVTLVMLEKWPSLAYERNEGLTALHVLAQRQPEGLSEAILIYKLWNLIRGMEGNEIWKFISEPSEVLLEAAKSGNFFILETLVKFIPYFSLRMQKIDNEGNNILHLIGKLSTSEGFESSSPDILLQSKLLSFKEMEKRVPPAFKSMKNKEGQTPKDIFYSTHKELIARTKKGMKDKANYGMLVTTIIATIVFAASLSIPGRDDSPEPSCLILQKQQCFIVFFLSNSVALFSSSASTMFFLIVLTSSCTEDELNSSLLLRLTFGVMSLFLAIKSMVLAFIAACLMILSQHSTWVAYLVASLGVSTLALLVLLLYTLFGDLFCSLYWSRYLLHQTKHHIFYPMYYSQRLKVYVVLSLVELKLKIYDKLAKLCQNSEAHKHVQDLEPCVHLRGWKRKLQMP